MKFVIPLPDNPYHLWQALVQLASFRELGYEEDVHYLIVYFFDRPSDLLLRLWESDEIRAYLHLYPDTRDDLSYPVSMKPWLMGQFFEQFPDEVSTYYTYLDPDCVLTRPMDFSPLLTSDGVWHGSDTGSYTGPDYLRSQGEQLFLDLCEISGVAPDQVIAHHENSIGAQVIVHGAPAEFWYEIERKSVRAYHCLKKYAAEHDSQRALYPIQEWCAEMYMQQFETIRAGFVPKATPLMEFSWATSPAELWSERPFFHDAGQPHEDGHHFCKLTWQSSPFRKEIQVSPSSASSHYVELIRRTEEMFPDLIWD